MQRVKASKVSQLFKIGLRSLSSPQPSFAGTAYTTLLCASPRCYDPSHKFLRLLAFGWAGRAASLPPKLVQQAVEHSASHSLERLIDRVVALLSKMTSAGDLDEQNLPSLPKDLLDGIGSLLNDKDLCKFELASKTLYTFISNPPRPCERQLGLDLCRSVSPQESRSLLQLTSFHDGANGQLEYGLGLSLYCAKAAIAFL